MNIKKLIKELKKLKSDANTYSNYALMNEGYRVAIMDAIDLVKKLTIPDVSNSLIAYQKWCYEHPEYDQVCESSKVDIYIKGNL